MSAAKFKKVMWNMRIIFSHRGVWRRLHAVVHQIWQILCSGETLSRSLILSRVFLDIVEAWVQILNKYGRLFSKERQEPSGHADAFKLTYTFVYCRSEEYYGFVSCCCTKNRISPKLKTFFHWYVTVCFLLVSFSAICGSRNVNRSGKNNHHDNSWRARVFEQRNRSTEKLFISLKGKRFQYCKIKMYFF